MSRISCPCMKRMVELIDLLTQIGSEKHCGSQQVKIRVESMKNARTICLALCDGLCLVNVISVVRWMKVTKSASIVSMKRWSAIVKFWAKLLTVLYFVDYKKKHWSQPFIQSVQILPSSTMIEERVAAVVRNVHCTKCIPTIHCEIDINSQRYLKRLRRPRWVPKCLF